MQRWGILSGLLVASAARAGEGIFITNHDLWKDLPKAEAPRGPKPTTVTGQADIERTPSIFDLSAHLNNFKLEVARGLGLVPRPGDVGASFKHDIGQLTARMACIRQKLAQTDPAEWRYLQSVCRSGDFAGFNRRGLNQRMHAMIDKLDHSLSPAHAFSFDPPCSEFNIAAPIFSRGPGKGVFNDRDFFALIATAEAEAESAYCPGTERVPLEQCRLAQMSGVISTLLERERTNHENRGETVDEQARDSGQYSVWNTGQPNWPCMVVGSFNQLKGKSVPAGPDQAVLIAFRDQSLVRAARPGPATKLDHERDVAWKQRLRGDQPVSLVSISPLGSMLHGIAELPKKQQAQVRQQLAQFLVKAGKAPLPPYRGLSVCERDAQGGWSYRPIQPRHYTSVQMALHNPPGWAKDMYACNNVCLVLPPHEPGGKEQIVMLSTYAEDPRTHARSETNGHMFYCYEPCSKVNQ